MKTIYRTLLAALLIAAGLFVINPSVSGASTDEESCFVQVPQTEWKYESFKTLYIYQKQVQTTKTNRLNGKVVEVSEWSWWSPPSFKESFKDVEVLEAGQHGRWNEGMYSFNRVYEYVKNGETKEVSQGWEESGWINGTNPPDELHNWIKIGERTVNGEQIPCSDQPEPVTREVTQQTLDCDTKLVTTTKDVFETPYILKDFVWVAGEEVQTVTGEIVSTRPASEDELLNEECMTTPAPKVVVSEWAYSEKPTCEVLTISRERTTTTTPYIWDEETQSYIEDTANIVTTVETEYITHDPEDIQGGCEEEVPPTTVPETPDTPPTTTPEVPATQTLPVTGAGTNILLIGTTLLCVGGALYFISRRRF